MDESNEGQAYRWQITINHPLEWGFSHEQIHNVLHNNFSTVIYYCMADEKGSCFHTHIYVVFSSRVRFSTIKKHFPQAHIEKAIASVSDNIDYIKKTGKWELDESKQEKKIEGTFEEFGTQPPNSKGRMADMSDLYQMVSDGMTNSEIIAQNQDLILQIDKIDKLRTTLLSDKYKENVRLDLEVIYISGPTKSGKTRMVFEENGYSKVYRITDYLHPFDGYACQPVVFFDEFRSSLQLQDMLLFIDIYPVELPSRFVNKIACYKRVYIVSNWGLEKQYSKEQDTDQESWLAFLSRISKVIVFEKDGTKTEYKSTDEYFSRERGETA